MTAMTYLNETPENWITKGSLQLRIDFSVSRPTSQYLNLQPTCRLLLRTSYCGIFVYWKIFLAHGKLRWFSIIKSKPSCTDGARHLLRSVHLSRNLTVEQKRRLLSIRLYSGMPIFLNRKTYFSPWLQTNHQHLREFGICRIVKACSSTRTSAVRQFKVPETQVWCTRGLPLDRLAKFSHNGTASDDWHFGGTCEAICDKRWTTQS